MEAVKPTFSYNFNGATVMDIAVTIDGQRREFSGVQGNSSVSTSNGYIITDSKDMMVSQIKNRYQNDLDAIERHEFYKKDSEQCKELLSKLNPQFAKEQAFDTAITDVSSRVDSMQGEISGLKDNVAKILQLLTDKNN